MKPPSRQGSSNDFQTPPEALDSIAQYIPKQWRVWECACGMGWLVNGLSERGYQVMGTDIVGGKDFLSWQPDSYDMILTNPPYSIKQQFLERAYRLCKPFAFLLPLTTFETRKRQTLFRDYGLEVVFLPERINFRTPSGQGSGSWFATAWFTNGLNIGRQMTFSEATHAIARLARAGEEVEG